MSVETILEFISTKFYPALLVVFFFGFTIFVHELGHFLAARRGGMKIDRFSIGFGPRIFGWVRDGVEYRVSWIPFGGYVALPQMAPMEVIEGKTDSDPNRLPPAPPTTKIVVAFAGPVMNLLLAFLLAVVIWIVGLPQPINPPVVGWVEPGSVEEQLGILPGDRIISVNDRPIKNWMDITRVVAISREADVRLVIERKGQRQEYLVPTQMNPMLGIKMIRLYPSGRPFARDVNPGSPAEQAGIRPGDKFLSVDGVPVGSAHELRELIGARTGQPTAIRVMRDGQILTLIATPAYNEQEKVGRIGVMLDDELEYEIIRPGPTPWQQFGDVFRLMGDTFYALFHSRETGVGARSLSGPVGIVGGWWHEIKNGGLMRGMWFAVLLNINLAILNLLPLPILDGGHILFALYERLFRRPLPSRLVHAVSTVMAVVLISLMLYITVFDFKRFFRFRFRTPPESSQTNQPVPIPEPAEP